MHSKSHVPTQENILLVIDDGDMLFVGNAVLAAENRRVLMAWNAERALWILRHLPVSRVYLYDEIADSIKVQAECAARGIALQFIGCSVEDGICKLILPAGAERTEGRTATANGF